MLNIDSVKQGGRAQRLDGQNTSAVQLHEVGAWCLSTVTLLSRRDSACKISSFRVSLSCQTRDCTRE